MPYTNNKIPATSLNFTNNKPVHAKDKNVMLNHLGELVSIKQPAKPKDTSGELLKLQKKHYGVGALSAILDGSFSELANTKSDITPESFFIMYRDLFYSIPKVGKESHTTLIEESTAYVGNYEDPKDAKMDSLLERVIELEQASVQTPSEHPLFPNGTAIRKGGALGIMQEGHLRGVSNQGNPSPYQALKKALGKTDMNGDPLGDEESWVRVNSQTWNSLPRWPVGSEINETADWSLSLQSFNPAVSNITVLTDLVAESELDEQELRFLREKLADKRPFLGNTIEDNYDGSISWSPEDLLPFGIKGDSEGAAKVYNKILENDTGIQTYLNSIITRHAQSADRGIYNFDHGSHLSSEVDPRYESDEYNPVSLYIEGHHSVYSHPDYHDYDERRRFTYDHEAIDEIETLKAQFSSLNVDDHPMVRYTWGIDFERNELYGIDDAKFFWVKDTGLTYRTYAIESCNIAIGRLRNILNTHEKFVSYEFNHIYKSPKGEINPEPPYYRFLNYDDMFMNYQRPGSGNYLLDWNNTSFTPNLVSPNYAPVF